MFDMNVLRVGYFMRSLRFASFPPAMFGLRQRRDGVNKNRQLQRVSFIFRNVLFDTDCLHTE
jgi:hypothetical protein